VRKPKRISKGFWARLARENLSGPSRSRRRWTNRRRRSTSGSPTASSTLRANCLDKHIGTPVENKTAIIFEADDGKVTNVTYKELLAASASSPTR
jgi:acetyl-CoA synthetase